MRNVFLLAGTVMLSACGGAGPQSIGDVAPVAGGSGNANEDTDPATGEPHSFVNPTKTTTYQAMGGTQHYEYRLDDAEGIADGDLTDIDPPPSQVGRLYDSNSTDVDNNALSVRYNRDDAEFYVSFIDDEATVNSETLYQDPAHRTDFGGAVEPSYGTPDLTGENVFYIQAGSANNLTNFSADDQPWTFDLLPDETDGGWDEMVFFYQRPGTITQYVTYAGFLRNNFAATRDEIGSPITRTFGLDRGALVFGEQTLRDDAPKTGSGSYEGAMLATMIFNEDIDNGQGDSYFQWIHGTSSINVDFDATTFSLSLEGTVINPQFDGYAAIPTTSVDAGSIFVAAGNGRFDAGLPVYRTFSGAFSSASITEPNGEVHNLILADPYMSANTIDGSFFGPAGEEVGGTFRVSHGEPDTRVDILGAFTGAPKP